jgi:hypothetical protein
MGLGTESEKSQSGLGGPAHALAQTGGRGSELGGGEGDRHARTRAEKRSGEKGSWRGGGHGHGGGGTAPAATAWPPPPVQHRLVSQLWPCEMQPWSYSIRVLSSSQAKEE